MDVRIGDKVYEGKDFNIGGKTYDVQQLLSKLRFLSKIKKNEKLQVDGLSVVKDTWITSVLRTFFYTAECREKALAFIKDTCNGALITIEVFFTSNNPFHREIGNMIVSTLNEAQAGIITYVETYKDDRMFISDVESFLNILRARINNLEKIYPSGETL